MFATLTNHRQQQQELTISHEERFRRLMEEKDREMSFLAKQARDAERLLREARSAHEEELRGFHAALEAERRKVTAERYHSSELQTSLERLRKEKERWNANGDNSREDFEALRGEVGRLTHQQRLTREQHSTREAEFQRSYRDLSRQVEATRSQRDSLMAENLHLKEQQTHGMGGHSSPQQAWGSDGPASGFGAASPGVEWSSDHRGEPPHHHSGDHSNFGSFPSQEGSGSHHHHHHNGGSGRHHHHHHRHHHEQPAGWT